MSTCKFSYQLFGRYCYLHLTGGKAEAPRLKNLLKVTMLLNSRVKKKIFYTLNHYPAYGIPCCYITDSCDTPNDIQLLLLFLSLNIFLMNISSINKDCKMLSINIMISFFNLSLQLK